MKSSKPITIATWIIIFCFTIALVFSAIRIIGYRISVSHYNSDMRTYYSAIAKYNCPSVRVTPTPATPSATSHDASHAVVCSYPQLPIRPNFELF